MGIVFFFFIDRNWEIGQSKNKKMDETKCRKNFLGGTCWRSEAGAKVHVPAVQ